MTVKQKSKDWNKLTETQYGFTWGCAGIERCCSDEKRGWILMRLITPKHDIQLYVTRSGKVRIFGKKEWRAIN